MPTFFSAKFHIYIEVTKSVFMLPKLGFFICGNLELTVFRVISLKHFFLHLVLYMQYALIIVTHAELYTVAHTSTELKTRFQTVTNVLCICTESLVAQLALPDVFNGGVKVQMYIY